LTCSRMVGWEEVSCVVFNGICDSNTNIVSLEILFEEVCSLERFVIDWIWVSFIKVLLRFNTDWLLDTFAPRIDKDRSIERSVAWIFAYTIVYCVYNGGVCVVS
jgi:hypothetical protein